MLKILKNIQTKKENNGIYVSLHERAENVNCDLFERVCYSKDAGPISFGIPDFVVQPRNDKEIQDILRLANQRRIPVYVRGGGTSAAGGGMPFTDGGLVLDMTRINKLISIDEFNLTVTVQAGITWEQLISELSMKGFRPRFMGPHSGCSAVVGGSVATASIGYGSTKYGSIGHQIIGLKVILPDGSIIKTGSGALKEGLSFARYCNGGDFAGLFIGSHGIFGVVYEVTLSIEPIPDNVSFSTYVFDKLENALKAAREVQIKCKPEQLVVYCHPDTVSSLTNFEHNNNAGISVIIDGFSEAAVSSGFQLLENVMKEYDGKYIGEKYAKRFWTNRFQVVTSLMKNGMLLQSCHMIPPSKLLDAVKVAEKYFYESNRIKDLGIKVFMNATFSDGISSNFVTNIFCEESNKEIKKDVLGIWETWMDQLLLTYGGAPYWLGYVWNRHLTDHLDNNYKLFIRKLKQCIDPNNILNPDSLIDGGSDFEFR